MDGLNNNTGPNLILVKTALDKLRSDETQALNVVGKATALHPVCFTQDSADKAAVTSSVLGGGGYFGTTTDDVPSPKESPKAAAALRTTVITQFMKNLPISRTFMADQQQSAVARSVRQETQAWIASRDRAAFSVYGNGFSGAIANSVTIDGVNLYSNAHVNENGDTIDNLETGVMGDDNLNTVVVSLRGQVNQTGVIAGFEPKVLLTPSALHKAGSATAKSVLRAGTGNNDQNYFSEYYPGMEVVYSPFLDAFSTTAYFVMTSGHDVMRFERESFFTTLVNWETQSNDQYIYKMRAREVTDAISYVGQVGSNGTTS